MRLIRNYSLGKFLRTLMLPALLGLSGCPPTGSTQYQPQFNPDEGAIDGDIIGADHQPFNLELAGGRKEIKIELLSPARGIVSTYPLDNKAHFLFNHVPPGRYELTVFIVVTGKRTIAGNLSAVVDPAKVTPAKLMLTVTPIDAPN